MQVKVINTDDAKEFERQVNFWLEQGYELHGSPAIQTVALQHQWDGGDVNSHPHTSYNQVLKKN